MTHPQDTLKATNELTAKFGALSNTYRSLILIYLSDKKEATWTEIRNFLESNSGRLNPNTLQFHLKALIENGFVVRFGHEVKSLYKLGKIDKVVTDMLRSVPRPKET